MVLAIWRDSDGRLIGYALRERKRVQSCLFKDGRNTSRALRLMPSLYAIKVFLTAIAFLLAFVPFAHSGWHYYRASKLPDDSPELKLLKDRRKSAAYEWHGWKIVCTALTLMLNAIVNIIP